jgi:hypothetical protein
MIIPGTADVDASTSLIMLRAPFGFSTARGVRVSNYNQDAIILTDISGTDQSQEFLMPLSQMVYPSVNAGRVPSARAFSSATVAAADAILVEWSDDPDHDFLGTYPVALPVALYEFHNTYIGNVTSTAQTYLTPQKSLALYIYSGDSGGGTITLNWNNIAPGFPQQSITIGGKQAAAAGSLVVQAGTLLLPTLSNSITVVGEDTVGCKIFGSDENVAGMVGIPNLPFASFARSIASGGSASTGFACANVFGPCYLDYVIGIQDTTTKGQFYFNPPGTNGNLTIGFADTSTMVTNASSVLSTVGRVICPPGLSTVMYRQLAATTGGLVQFDWILSPINS